MCDTIAIVRKDAVYFAKNSDRDPNEAQYLAWNAPAQYGPGSKVKCTWIEIPQVEETHATLLSKPFWIWGAEMGTNEHGVCIGNETVFTKTKNESKPGLIGMDLVRLALERADSAAKACEVIVSLLEHYGQGGGAGHEKRKWAYQNSFMVADPKSAFVLETAGRLHAIEKVEGTRTISNGLTIPAFAEKHSDYLKTRISSCRTRQGRTHLLSAKTRGVPHLFAALRDHGARYSEPSYRWINGAMASPCMHGGGVIASSQTTASWVTEMTKEHGIRHWATATAAPCTSLFKPVALDQPLDLGMPTDKRDDSLWWRHEQFHRLVVQNPAAYRDFYVPERNALEADWSENPPASAEAFAKHDELLVKWLAAAKGVNRADIRPGYVQKYWRKREGLAGIG
ncbi:MAG: carcinine hydrolase/isopenicillin-N N-acyltransferase family protein [Candidatus Hydrogenedentes bacterium]|nr:carcinine hydrolase/isopenicillin-N N-acyltransferase family protein [Candidatus Hydrogenedentota bacterium]